MIANETVSSFFECYYFEFLKLRNFYGSDNSLVSVESLNILDYFVVSVLVSLFIFDYSVGVSAEIDVCVVCCVDIARFLS